MSPPFPGEVLGAIPTAELHRCLIVPTLRAGLDSSHRTQSLKSRKRPRYSLMSKNNPLGIKSYHFGKEKEMYAIVSPLKVNDASNISQIVSKESATFGLPGSRENIIRLEADHGDICPFGDSQRDQDNFEIVKGNIEELYLEAINNGELHIQLIALSLSIK
jgi:hypothetical protein